MSDKRNIDIKYGSPAYGASIKTTPKDDHAQIIPVLVGIGAGFMAISLIGLNMHEDNLEFPIMTGTAGLGLWTAAGIIYFTDK